jgi:hypothetical protein
MSNVCPCVQLRLSTRMLQEVRVINVEALGSLMDKLEQVGRCMGCNVTAHTVLVLADCSCLGRIRHTELLSMGNIP